MEHEKLQQEFRELSSRLAYPGIYGQEVFPKTVQHIVEYASGHELSVATIDRYARQFTPAVDFWNAMHHSFYRLLYRPQGHLAVGDFSLPQKQVYDERSLMQVVQILLERYPLDGVAVRKEKHYAIPTGGEQTVESRHFETVIKPKGFPLPGYSIMQEGKLVCLCDLDCDICTDDALDVDSSYFMP